MPNLLKEPPMKPFLSMSVGVLSLACLLSACAGPVTYTAEPIEARLVDATTKQPIENAIVIAHWELIGGMHPGRVGDLVVMETVTDKNGRFHFPGWGPIRHWKRSWLSYKDPALVIFKGDYQYRVLVNEATPETIGGKAYPIRRSQWNKQVIELQPFNDSRKEYGVSFKNVHDYIERIAIDNPEECTWKKIPHAIRAVSVEQQKLSSEKLWNNSYDSVSKRLFINSDLYAEKGKCGSPKEFLKEILS
jgi:hypothetical protein